MEVRESLSYQHQQILRYIELRAQWEGRINAKHIAESFNIGRELGGKLINRYNDTCPNNLTYDASAKAHLTTEKFTPQLTTGTLEEYIYGFFQADLPDEQTGWTLKDTFPMRQFGRAPRPEIVRPILNAIQNKRKLDIAYLSMNSPEYEGRIISPHNLIHDGARFHVRARCEKNQDFRDFVLSRITQIYDDEGPAEHGEQDDERWNTWVTLTIEPDIRLIQSKKEIVAYDYCMNQNAEGRYQCQYTVRAALLIYTLKYLGLDRLREKAEAQQIMLTPECQNDIEKYLT
ncbi:helix-turn-helix transcriptional regulator [Thalassolituus oleivorans]|uniref:helix-turn-helix transcriptional regulator n=1 Tax=Thalassolituus oleivorans TaxID=187493 RepID=UPI0023F4CE99|nr:WYL domain-containing protein [Thalassolituus oleivorans]